MAVAMVLTWGITKQTIISNAFDSAGIVLKDAMALASQLSPMIPLSVTYSTDDVLDVNLTNIDKFQLIWAHPEATSKWRYQKPQRENKVLTKTVIPIWSHLSLNTNLHNLFVLVDELHWDRIRLRDWGDSNSNGIITNTEVHKKRCWCQLTEEVTGIVE